MRIVLRPLDRDSQGDWLLAFHSRKALIMETRSQLRRRRICGNPYLVDALARHWNEMAHHYFRRTFFAIEPSGFDFEVADIAFSDRA